MARHRTTEALARRWYTGSNVASLMNACRSPGSGTVARPPSKATCATAFAMTSEVSRIFLSDGKICDCLRSSSGDGTCEGSVRVRTFF